MAESFNEDKSNGLYPDISNLDKNDKYEPDFLVKSDISVPEKQWNFPTTACEEDDELDGNNACVEGCKIELNLPNNSNKERRRNNRLQSGAVNDKYSNAQRFPGGHSQANIERPHPTDDLQNPRHLEEILPEEQIQAGENPLKEGGRRNRESFVHRETKEMVFFWREGSPFSQWHPAKFIIDGVEFNCAEQYMMYNKAKISGNDGMADVILKEPDPDVQKKYGRDLPNFNPNIWLGHREEVVKKGNKAKFSQNEHLKQKLLATYPKRLVEASPHDTVWGIGLSAYDKGVEDVVNWRGENLLGDILTDVRDEILKEMGFL